MNLLALETATSVCSVALLQDGGVTVELTLRRPRAHSENLVPMIDDAVRYGGLSPADLDAVAVSSGPGSYTGLRIGVSTAKGLATATDAALVAVPSLEALAASTGGVESGDVVAAAFDARRDESYAAAYVVDGSGAAHEVRAAVALLAENAADWLSELASESDGGLSVRDRSSVRAAGRRVHLVGDGWSKVIPDLAGMPLVVHSESALSPASAVARLGAARLEAGHTEDPNMFEPYYLRDFVATKPRATAFEKLPF